MTNPRNAPNSSSNYDTSVDGTPFDDNHPRITVTVDQGSYNFGQILSGTVELNLARSRKYHQVTLALTGTIQIEDGSVENLFKPRILTLAKASKRPQEADPDSSDHWDKLHIGKHVFPFAFDIPGNATAHLSEDLRDEDDLERIETWMDRAQIYPDTLVHPSATVQYALTVRIEAPESMLSGPGEDIFRKPLRVFECWPAILPSPSSMVRAERVECAAGGPEPYLLGLQLVSPQLLAKPSTMLPLRVRVTCLRNARDTQPMWMQASLDCTIEIVSNPVGMRSAGMDPLSAATANASSSSTSTPFARTLTASVARSREVSISRGRTYEWPCTLKLPPTLYSSMHHARLTVRYWAVLRAYHKSDEQSQEPSTRSVFRVLAIPVRVVQSQDQPPIHYALPPIFQALSPRFTPLPSPNASSREENSEHQQPEMTEQERASLRSTLLSTPVTRIDTPPPPYYPPIIPQE